MSVYSNNHSRQAAMLQRKLFTPGSGKPLIEVINDDLAFEMLSPNNRCSRPPSAHEIRAIFQPYYTAPTSAAELSVGRQSGKARINRTLASVLLQATWLSTLPLVRAGATMDYLTELRRFHQYAIQPYLGVPKGCSPHTLAQFEQSIAHELPLAYRQYLAWMGEDYSGIFQGTNCFLTDVQANTAALSTLIAENNIAFVLPATLLVFYLHQGYVAAWFALPKESDNPLVWFFSEGQDMTQPVTAGTFTDFLLTDMKVLATVLAETRRTTAGK